MRRVLAASQGQSPAFGGPRLPIDRPGDHWAIEIEAAALKTCCGLAFTVDVRPGRRVGVRIPLKGMNIGPVGAGVVDGASPMGSLLPVRGLTPYAAIRKGWFLSLSHGDGQTFQVEAEVIVNADGEVEIPVWPMIRAPLPDGAVVELAEPFLRGQVLEGGDYEAGLFAAVAPSVVVIEEV